MEILKINKISKSYKNITAIDQFSLSINKGNVYGILGPNGSGKTTILGIILGVIISDSGSFTWFENPNTPRYRMNIGALLETPNFYPYMNAEQNLKIIAQIKKIKSPKIDEYLELVNLLRAKKQKFFSYSLGMKQRLAIAATLVGDPTVLILDEPTNGLDPHGIVEVRNTIKQIAGTGKTIIMASHNLDEVEKLCTHIVIIKDGKLLANGTVTDMANPKRELIELSAKKLEELHTVYSKIPKILNVEKENGFLLLEVSDHFSTENANEIAFNNGFILSHLSNNINKTLESEFLRITGQ